MIVEFSFSPRCSLGKKEGIVKSMLHCPCLELHIISAFHFLFAQVITGPAKILGKYNQNLKSIWIGFHFTIPGRLVSLESYPQLLFVNADESQFHQQDAGSDLGAEVEQRTISSDDSHNDLDFVSDDEVPHDVSPG